ncbi:MAG: sigma-54 dependent transcriptional regulator [Hyphomicrobiales bacterium]
MVDASILVVDDDPANISRTREALADIGLPVIGAADGREALAEISRLAGPHGFAGIVITDLKMPVMDGQELLGRIRQDDPELPVIVISAYGEVASAVAAMRAGAYDFLERPIVAEDLKSRVERALRTRALAIDNRRLRSELANRPGIATRIIGNSTAIQKLREDAASIAGTDATVLIHGATGTGKEVVARVLHEFGKRSRARFVAINCGALSENMIESELFGHEAGAFTDAKQRRIGLAEHAKGGTLFLDEIESMPLGLQVKLLRMLQERVIVRLGSNEEIKIDVRVVAATKTDLREAANRKEFREDLYYRLNVAELYIPALNDRRDDIPLLFDHFVNEFAARHQREPLRPAPAQVEALIAHDWRGNVRELRNVAERFVLGLGGSHSSLLDAEAGASRPLPEQLDAIEAMLIRNALAADHGHVQAAADRLGLPRRTLSEKMRKHGLDGQDFR